MTIDVEEASRRIVRFVSDDGHVDVHTAMEAILIATATLILMFAKDDPVDVSERFAGSLTDMIAEEAESFPKEFQVGRLQ